MKDSTFIIRVILKNYKSSAACDVQLRPLTFLAVEAHKGTTAIARVDEAERAVVYDKLFTIGNLLRHNQLQPHPASVVSTERRNNSVCSILRKEILAERRIRKGANEQSNKGTSLRKNRGYCTHFTDKMENSIWQTNPM